MKNEKEIFNKISQGIIEEEKRFFPESVLIEVGSINIEGSLVTASIKVDYNENHHQMFLDRKYQLKVLKNGKESIYLISKNI
jgi:hypothetical protein